MAGSIERAPLLSPDEKQQVLKYLDALPDGKAVCHGDFHPDNILMTKDGPVIMDWMTICIGDPAADVARTLLMMTTAELPESVPGWAKRLLNMARQNITKAYYQEYLRLSGLERNAAEQWTLPLAAARLNERRPAQEAEMLHAMVTTMLAHT